MNLQFVETSLFTKQVEGVGRELLQAIQNDLLKNPERGDLIQGMGGARKGRAAFPGSGRGKRGSYRYIYLYLRDRGRVYLIWLYGKTEQADLSADQKKELRQIIDKI